MKHSILAFDRTNEQLAFDIELPDDQFAQLAEIMAWQDPDDVIYEYDLSPEQVNRLEALTGKAFSSPDYIFQLSCTA